MSQTQTITVPDIGDAKGVSLIEINVAVGDTVSVDDPLVTLEGDKATMEVPALVAGTIESISCKVGDEVSEGDALMTMTVAAGSKPESTSMPETKEELSKQEAPQKMEEAPKSATPKEVAPAPVKLAASSKVYASPSVRRLAAELGIVLESVQATGDKGRTTRDDLHNFIKQQMQGGGSGFTMPSVPVVDFSQFGETESLPMNKIKKLTGAHVHASWINVPHVTQFDEADITDMDAFRQSKKDEAAKLGIKLTPIVFVMKAVVAALKAFPHFNASLAPSGDAIILKRYYHIGVAVDTPNGLVVPVIRDVDQKGLYDLSKELIAISEKARTKGLSPTDMQGGCFTISSLGGIGGTAFTPIVNVPEVAILGLSKAQIKPVFSEGEFKPRLMMPMSLSYDHRVIDGADGARFTATLAKHLSNINNLLL